MTYRAYLSAMNLEILKRAPASAIEFDLETGEWVLGTYRVRSEATSPRTVRFTLVMTGKRETLVGGYSGTIGATPAELAHYLVYFLETGKPWHQGLPNQGLG